MTIWVKWKGTMLSEISQIEKDKYCMVSLICGILKKKKRLNSETKSKEVVVKVVGGGGNRRGRKKVHTFSYKRNEV